MLISKPGKVLFASGFLATRSFFAFIPFLLIAVIASFAWAQASPTVTLTILNPPNPLGQIVVAVDDDVEVEYIVVDLQGAS